MEESDDEFEETLQGTDEFWALQRQAKNHNQRFEVMVPRLNLRQPSPLKLFHDASDMAKEWRRFAEDWKWFEVGMSLKWESPMRRMAIFMSTIGSEVEEIKSSFRLLPDEANVDVLLKRFEQHFLPAVNEVYESHEFLLLRQESKEQFDQFLSRASAQVIRCNYGSKVFVDRMLRDKIVHGIASPDTKETLLKTRNLDVQQAVDICRSHEAAKRQAEKMVDAQQVKVALVKQLKQADKTKRTEKSAKEQESTFQCADCGYRHAEKKCPAAGRRCRKCQEKGHFARKCPKKSVKLLEEDDSSDESLYLAPVRIESQPFGDPWREMMTVGDRTIMVKLDTGAQCNAMSLSTARSIGIRQLEQCKVKRLVSFSNDSINVLGQATVKGEMCNKEMQMSFIIVKENVSTVVGAKTCEEENLIRRVRAIDFDDELFKGLGRVKGFTYDIELKEGAEFEFYPARSIPPKLREAVKKELDRMEAFGVIQKVTRPTPAVSPMVVVQKNGKLRVCIDPSAINKWVRRRHYPMQTLDQIATRLAGSKDCNKGFWQIPVSERTSEILTFATPWGRYSCLRMPFGLASAPEIFSQILVDALQEVEGVEVSMDDVLIHAETKEELIEQEKAVLDIIRAKGITLNKEKCVFGATKVKFHGHNVSERGLEIDEEKVEAINKMRTPRNREELQRFLGAVNYVGRFCPNLSLQTEPLRALIRKENAFVWGADQQDAFETIKRMLVNAPVLKLYDVNEDVTLTVDASSHSLGAALLQGGRPVAYAAKALTETQSAYPQIKKEALAIRFACTKFHDMIYGKRLVVESDHRPLESIFRKSMVKAPPRLRRIMLDVMQYAPKVVYKKGSELKLADSLSRDVEASPEEEQELEVLLSLAMSDEFKARLQRATIEDSLCIQLKKIVDQGWPEKFESVPVNLRAFFEFRDEISHCEQILFRGQRVIIPEQLKKEVLGSIHKGHPGRNSALSRTEGVFWLGISADVIKMAENCGTCQRFRPTQRKDPICERPVAKKPWEFVAADLFKCGDEYLIVTDDYSGYFVIRKLLSTSSSAVIGHLKDIFSEHGSPKTLKTDGGPQFDSKEFEKFAEGWDFNHEKSSPEFARSNGLVERSVQTAKNLIKRCRDDGSDLMLALLYQRNTPRSKDLGSSAQRLMSRSTRSPTTSVDERLEPKVIPKVAENLQRERERQKEYADRGARKIQPPLQEGTRVFLRNKKTRQWRPGTILSRVTDRSYNVKLEDGRIFRRNLHFIHPAKRHLSKEDGVVAKTNEQNLIPTGADSAPQEPEGDIQTSGDSTSATVLDRSPGTSRYGRRRIKPDRLTYN